MPQPQQLQTQPKRVTHRSKPHKIRLSESGKPHELPPADWFALVDSGAAKLESDTKAARVAILRLPFIGWVQCGQLWVARIGASIPSQWLAWEREFWRRVDTLSAKLILSETFDQREARVLRERETALFIEALDWQTNRQRRNRNGLRWVSPAQLREVLAAFGRLPAPETAESTDAVA